MLNPALALVGYEWIIVLAIVIVLFVWGPKITRDWARAVGQLRHNLRSPLKGGEEK